MKGSTKEYVNQWTTALISLASKVVFQSLHARLQHYGNLQMSKVGLEKEEELDTKLPTFNGS